MQGKSPCPDPSGPGGGTGGGQGGGGTGGGGYNPGDGGGGHGGSGNTGGNTGGSGGSSGGGSGGSGGGTSCDKNHWQLSHHVPGGEVWVNDCGETKLVLYAGNMARTPCPNSVSSGTVITSFDINTVVNNISTKLATYGLYLSQDAVNFLKENNQRSITAQFNNYLTANNNLQGAQFVNWGINFYMQNPDTTWTQFENWLPYTSYFLNKFNEDSKILSYFLLNNINTNFNALSVDYKTRMSQQELQMYNNLSIIQQFFYLVSANTAEKKAQQKYPNSLYNGNGDAYRHTTWNAYATRYIGKETTEQLTTAHENRPPDPNNPYESKENEMDLYNNYMGRGIGYSNPLSIEYYVDLWLTNGNLYYLSNLEGELPSGKPTINSQLIPTNQ